MSKSIVPVLAAVLILATGAFQSNPAQAQQPPTPDLSQALRKTFIAAQEAQKAKRWPEVIAKAQEVLGTSNRKPDDTYYANYLLYEAYKATGNELEMRKALLGLIDSGFLSPTQQAQYLKGLMSMAFQARDYDAAAGFGTRMTRSNTADPSVFTMIGQSYYQKGDYAESARFFKSLVNEQIKRGQIPLEPNLVMMQSAYEKLGDKTGATDALEMLVVYYPKPDFWEALLYSVRNSSSLQTRQRLFVFRLMWATNTLKLRQDYDRFAQGAESVGLLAETQKVLEAGIKSSVFAGPELARADRLMNSAKGRAELAKATLPQLEMAAASAATGEKDVQLGMLRYSYGEADKAIPILQRGLGKGGLQPDQQVEAQLMLGIAQLRSKDKPGAQKTFGSIKTSDSNWQRIVRFWTLYAK